MKGHGLFLLCEVEDFDISGSSPGAGQSGELHELAPSKHVFKTDALLDTKKS